MKITGSGPGARTGQTRRAASGTGEAAASAFAGHVGSRPVTSSGIAPATPLAALDGVLAVQEVADPTGERRRAVRRGHSLLDELRELQLGLAEGGVSEGTLRRLAGLLDGLRPAADPQLDLVLEAIELRAAVELTKLRRGPA